MFAVLFPIFRYVHHFFRAIVEPLTDDLLILKRQPGPRTTPVFRRQPILACKVCGEFCKHTTDHS